MLPAFILSIDVLKRDALIITFRNISSLILREALIQFLSFSRITLYIIYRGESRELSLVVENLTTEAHNEFRSEGSRFSSAFNTTGHASVEFGVKRTRYIVYRRARACKSGGRERGPPPGRRGGPSGAAPRLRSGRKSGGEFRRLQSARLKRARP